MTELQLETGEWDESILTEVSQFVYDNRIGIYRNAEDAEGVKRYLSNIQERFPAEAIFIVRKSGSICGWCALDRDSETVAELGRWQPIIEKSDSEVEIADLILQGILDYATQNGITLIESQFNGVNYDNSDDYERSAKWFKSHGFSLQEDMAYLTMQLGDIDLGLRKIPEGMVLEPLKTVDEEHLYECYYDSFVTGEDRSFLDINEKQRREKFDKSLQSDSLNHHLSSVLKDGDRIIGFAFIQSREDEEHVDRFGILKEYRGRGLAKSHLIHVIDQAKSSGTPIVSIGVDTSNKDAFNLYENVGFELNDRAIIHVWKTE
jgi:ribosomal protein S18 acetylase RimI-like enzyme